MRHYLLTAQNDGKASVAGARSDPKMTGADLSYWAHMLAEIGVPRQQNAATSATRRQESKTPIRALNRITDFEMSTNNSAQHHYRSCQSSKATTANPSPRCTPQRVKGNLST